jgi:hypothetical protein
MARLGVVLSAYAQAALFTETDDEGEPLDRNRYLIDIDADSVAKMLKDCEKFVKELSEGGWVDYWTDDEIGHNFWLTRNGHGTGFWDRDRGETGEATSKIARRFGEAHLLVGDDGRLHYFNRQAANLCRQAMRCVACLEGLDFMNGGER